MISILLKLITGNKYFQYGLIALGFVLSYGTGYLVGYDNGEEDQKIIISKQYGELMTKKLEENTLRLEKQFNLAIQAEKEKSKVVTIFQDRIVKVKEIVKESKVLNNPVCIIPKNEIDEINRLTGEIK